MSQLRWTSKSTRTMAEELTRLGHPVSWVTVARCLDDMGYSLQANRKSKEGPQHADRDAQFRYINRQVKALLPDLCTTPGCCGRWLKPDTLRDP